MEACVLLQVKGTGVSGSFKLNKEKELKPKIPVKKPAGKKPTAEKPLAEKRPRQEGSGYKKPVAKATAKKSAAKKTTRKPAAKKVTKTRSEEACS